MVRRQVWSLLKERTFWHDLPNGTVGEVLCRGGAADPGPVRRVVQEDQGGGAEL